MGIIIVLIILLLMISVGLYMDQQKKDMQQH